MMEMNNSSVYTVKVRRGTPENAWYQEYTVPAQIGQSIFGALQYIYEHLDSTLAFGGSCRIGLCSSCIVRVNGKVVRACTTLIKGDILVEPYKQSCVIRDLMVLTSSITVVGRENLEKR
jgi:succinate dehydrogenase/fumarate reductase-like Fe-S protein